MIRSNRIERAEKRQRSRMWENRTVTLQFCKHFVQQPHGKTNHSSSSTICWGYGGHRVQMVCKWKYIVGVRGEGPIKPITIWGKEAQIWMETETSVMESLGQEPLTKVTEKPWVWVFPLLRHSGVSGLNKTYKGVHRWPSRCPSDISWGREWRDVVG